MAADSITATHSTSRLARYWNRFLECLACIVFCCYRIRRNQETLQHHVDIESQMTPSIPLSERSTSVSSSSNTVSIPTIEPANSLEPSTSPAPAPADKTGCINLLNDLFQQYTTEIDTMHIPMWTTGGGEYSAQATTVETIDALKAMYHEDLVRQIDLCREQIINSPDNDFQTQYTTCRNDMIALRNARYHLARLPTPEEMEKPFYPGRTSFINHNKRQCGFISATLAAFHEGIVDYFILRPIEDPGQRIDEDPSQDINNMQRELSDTQAALALTEYAITRIQQRYDNQDYRFAQNPEEYFTICMNRAIEDRNRYTQGILDLNEQLRERRQRREDIQRNNRRYEQQSRLIAQQNYWRNISQDILYNRRSALRFIESVNYYIPSQYVMVRKTLPRPVQNETTEEIDATEMEDFLNNRDWRALAGGGRAGLRRRRHWWTYVRNPDHSVALIDDDKVTVQQFPDIRALSDHFRNANWEQKQLYYYE